MFSRLRLVNAAHGPCRTFVLVALAIACATSAAAQTEATETKSEPRAVDRKWIIDVHGGWSIQNQPAGGTGTLPVTGTMANGIVSASTLYFGAGSQLFNQNTVGALVAPSIVALDPVVTAAAVQRPRGAGTVGTRLERSFGRMWGLEVAGDYSWSGLELRPAASSAIEATRASFAPAVTQVLASASNPASATSISSLTSNQSSQAIATAALVINGKARGRVVPYFVGGGGVVFAVGDTPVASLTGSYQFGASSQVFGTDRLLLSYAVPTWSGVAIAGGGVKYSVRSRWGMRLDGRAYISQNRVENLASTSPVRNLQSASAPFPTVTSGSLQFSSTAPLTGDPLSGTTTFRGSGFQVRIAILAGVFWRL